MLSKDAELDLEALKEAGVIKATGKEKKLPLKASARPPGLPCFSPSCGAEAFPSEGAAHAHAGYASGRPARRPAAAAALR